MSRSSRPLALTGVLGLGAGVALLLPTAAQADAPHDIRINEVSSNSAIGAPDFVELINTGTAPVDLTGWVFRDNDDTRGLTLPPTVLEPGGLLVLHPDEGPAGFGLGANDSARLYLADGVTPVDAYSWTDHAFSEGRLPDGTGEFVDTEPTPGAPNVAREVREYYDATETVAVNEVVSDDPDDGPDWVELVNTGDEPVDLSGWILRDDDDLSNLALPAGTVLDPGAFLTVDTNATDAGFSLGKDDRIRLYLADGLGLVDEHAWTAHVFGTGRVPDGTGGFVDTVPTKGSVNVARSTERSVVVNEVESNGDARGDWVELANTDTVRTVDLTGWTLVDGDPTHDPIVLDGTIESGGHRAILTEPHFGLGGQDSVILRDASGAVVDSFSWTSHAPTTYGRCPDMTGPFGVTAEGSYELRNNCQVVTEPEIVAEAWPFGNDVHEGVAPGTWGEDMSGLDVAPDGTVLAVNNDNAEIFALTGDGDRYTVTGSWLPTYPDGTGRPDAEGLSLAGDGSIFLATERDNLAKAVSRASVLRVVTGPDGAVTTTHEWNLTPITGPLGANGGLEGVEWISDADATRLGVRAADGTAYDPAAFGDHFGGILAVAVEQTGAIHLVVLEADGTASLLQTAQASTSVPVLMDLDWRAGGNELWGLCDEACDNRTSVFAFQDGVLTWQVDHHAPTGMNPAFTNEGLTFLWCATDPAAAPTTLWISDTAHDGVSLRFAPGDECTDGGEDPGTPTTPPGTPTPGTPTPGVPTPVNPQPTPGTATPAPTGPTTTLPVDDAQLTDATRGGLRGPATVTPGQTVTYTLAGVAGSTVHVWLHSTPVLLATLTPSDDRLTVTVPTSTVPGAHRVVVQGADGGVLGWTEVEVRAADGAGVRPDLADTGVGGELPVLLAVSGLLALAGGGLLLAARRRVV